MMASQVVRPQIPHQGAIPGGLHNGKLIEIKGSVPYGADIFEVNLLTGFDLQSDRALHLSVRFSSRVAVRNSLECNQWGYEERDGPFPFGSGRQFTMMILVEATSYRIAVNSQHCWEFVHRVPIQRVNSLYINGSVQIERIEYVNHSSPAEIAVCPSRPTTGFPAPHVGYPGTNLFPTTGPFFPGMPSNYPLPGQGIDPSIVIPPPMPRIIPSDRMQPASNLAPVYNPNIPYAYPIYGGLKPGMMIYISGRPSASAHKFTINLQIGTNPYPPPDIGFHFDMRFYSNSIVRNSRVMNNWESEENHIPFFPFERGVNFDMIIKVEGDRYMVALNGQHFVEFAHRMWPLSRIDTLYIENDIVVSSIRFS